MPLYQQSVFKPSPQRMQANFLPIYLFGSFDTKVTPFVYKVTHVARTTNVATLTVTLQSGGGSLPGSSLPSVGAILGVQGAVTAGFNTNYAAVTAVAITGASGTISYANSGANVATTADVGTCVVLPGEQADVDVVQGSTSAPVALSFTPDDADNSRCLSAEAKWVGTMPTSATVILQWANVDDDSRYMTLQNAQGCLSTGVVAASDALATVASGAVTQSGAQYSFILGKFLRAKILAMTGGDATTGLIVTLFP